MTTAARWRVESTYSAVPIGLRDIEHWVAWKAVPKRDGSGRTDKIPYCVGLNCECENRRMDDHRGSSTDARTWGSFDTALDYHRRHKQMAGIGVALTRELNLCGIDLDHCIHLDTGEIEEWALAVVRQFNSYTERSPSGTGLRIFVNGMLPQGEDGRKNGNIEAYVSGRFLTVTGRHLDGTPLTIEDRATEVLAFHTEAFPTRSPNASANGRGPQQPVDLDDAEIIRKAQNAVNGGAFSRLWRGDYESYYASQSSADFALIGHLIFWTGGDADRIERLFRASGLYRPKWDARRGDSIWGKRSIQNALASYNGNYYGGPQPRSSSGAVEAQSALEQPAAERKQRQMAPNGMAPMTLSEVLAVFQKWLYMPDTGTVEVALGTVAANYYDGEAVWLLEVGPPSSGKTEPLNSTRLLPHIHAVAVATEGALLSGTSKKEAAKGAKGGLLREMGMFGIMVLKDFTSVLSMHKEARAQLLAALREIYDGSWTRHVGTDGGRTLHWEGKAGLLGGVTGAIDTHHAVMASLGERFLLYRLPETDESARAHRALKFTGREIQMRSELAEAVAGLFAGIEAPTTAPALTDAGADALVALSTFVARARSAVERDTGPSRDITLIPGAESPTRLIKQLSMLLAGLLLIGCTPSRAWELVRKVALDSMPQTRRHVIEVLLASPVPLTTRAVSNKLGYPTTTIRRTLEELACYSLVTKNEEREGTADHWHATDWTEKMYAAATTVPGKCDHVHSNSNGVGTLSPL